MPMRGRANKLEVNVGALSRAGSLPHLDRVQLARDWSAVTPPALANQLPHKSKPRPSLFTTQQDER